MPNDTLRAALIEDLRWHRASGFFEREDLPEILMLAYADEHGKRTVSKLIKAVLSENVAAWIAQYPAGQFLTVHDRIEAAFMDLLQQGIVGRHCYAPAFGSNLDQEFADSGGAMEGVPPGVRSIGYTYSSDQAAMDAVARRKLYMSYGPFDVNGKVAEQSVWDEVGRQVREAFQRNRLIIEWGSELGEGIEVVFDMPVPIIADRSPSKST